MYLKRFAAVALALTICIQLLFLPMVKPTKSTLAGPTNTAAGDYVVTGTDDVYHFQGEEFEVYNVYYDNPPTT